MEYLRVTFDPNDIRDVIANGEVIGQTEAELAVQPNYYVISLSGADYEPPTWNGVIQDTLPVKPLTVAFKALKEAQRAAADINEIKSAADPPPQASTTSATVLTLAGFTSDRVAANTAGATAADPLGIRGDVQALARLICLEEATPPLSIAVFGGWGSGKSTFMEQLEAEIHHITTNEANRRERLRAASANAVPSGELNEPRFIANVVQIRFNAWQFADANLWASLTAEFFDQLRAGGYSRTGKEIHSQLVQRVTDHIHSLSGAVDATRGAMLQGEKQLIDAQKARDVAVNAAEQAESGVWSQALVNKISEAYEKHKSDLAAIYPEAANKNIDDFLSLTEEVRTFRGQVKIVLKMIRGKNWRLLLTIFAGLMIIAAFILLLFEKFAGVGLTLLAGVASAAGAILPAVRLVNAIMKNTSAVVGELDKDEQGRLKQVVIREVELRAAADEVEARREALQRAAQLLARYVDPQGNENPPRLLRFVLEDDPDTKALEKEIGLIGRVRRLFQAVDVIVKRERENRKRGNIYDTDVPDRLILYIDDLDRCTYEQVYAVLQAIHLLLAFELFVVVVGVDMRWVEDALAGQSTKRPYETGMIGGLGGEVEPDRRKRAIAYLEKIFQIPFWLRPLSTQGATGGTYGDYVRGLLKFDERIAGQRTTGVDTAGRAAGDDPPADDHEGGPATLAEALATVQLTTAEVDFLASRPIGRLAASAPRGVKRMINVYRIARARMSPGELQELLGQDQKPPTYPIAVIFAAVETGQPVEVADGLYAELRAADETLRISSIARPNGSVPRQGNADKTFQVGSEELHDAFEAARELRKGAPMSVGECVAMARVLRRYSFNFYQ